MYFVLCPSLVVRGRFGDSSGTENSLRTGCLFKHSIFSGNNPLGPACVLVRASTARVAPPQVFFSVLWSVPAALVKKGLLRHWPGGWAAAAAASFSGPDDISLQHCRWQIPELGNQQRGPVTPEHPFCVRSWVLDREHFDSPAGTWSPWNHAGE
eukprot:gene8153-biopygen10620